MNIKFSKTEFTYWNIIVVSCVIIAWMAVVSFTYGYYGQLWLLIPAVVIALCLAIFACGLSGCDLWMFSSAFWVCLPVLAMIAMLINCRAYLNEFLACRFDGLGANIIRELSALSGLSLIGVLFWLFMHRRVIKDQTVFVEGHLTTRASHISLPTIAFLLQLPLAAYTLSSEYSISFFSPENVMYVVLAFCLAFACMAIGAKTRREIRTLMASAVGMEASIVRHFLKNNGKRLRRQHRMLVIFWLVCIVTFVVHMLNLPGK